jgi:hypothetical protein
MTPKTKKILIISASTLLGGVMVYFVYDYFKLKALYAKVSSEDEALKALQNPSTPLIELGDSDIQKAAIDGANEEGYQYNSNGSDDINAVVINGITYIWNYDTYWFENGNDYYDPITDSLTVGENTMYINPTTVVYGIVDNNGGFTYA